MGSGADALEAALDHVVESGAGSIPHVDDPLAGALHHLRMDGMFYCLSDLTAPWGLTLPPMPDCLWFHVLTHGECVLIAEDGTTVTARAGDVVVLPHGAGHRAADHPDSPAPVVLDLPHHYISRHYATLEHGGGGEACRVVCGVVHLGHPAARMLIGSLPPLIHIDAGYGREHWPWLSSLLALMATEAEAMRPGGETVITRLSDILVVQAIRAWIETEPAAQTGWLQALRDPLVGRAIALVHADPARDWTVSSLAREVGTSRSGLSARFTDLLGASPKQYITGWRMALAEDWLRDPTRGILEIALALGYHSEAAFSRAFKRETGIPPSAARRRPDPTTLVEVAT